MSAEKAMAATSQLVIDIRSDQSFFYLRILMQKIETKSIMGTPYFQGRCRLRLVEE